MTVMTNQQRAAQAEKALAQYDDLPESALIDLLADTMHWCDLSGHGFHIALAQACRHYINELNDDQHDERRMP